MATNQRRLSFSDTNTILGAIQPDICRTDNKIMQLNGHPISIFTVQTVTTPELNLNLQTRLTKVLGGIVKNMTTGVTVALRVIALSSNASIAVVVGSLPADNLYLVIVYGTEYSNN